jgi:hypothetical protein
MGEKFIFTGVSDTQISIEAAASSFQITWVGIVQSDADSKKKSGAQSLRSSSKNL